MKLPRATLPGSPFDPDPHACWLVFVAREAGRVLVYERTCGSERAGWDRCAELSRQGLVAYCSRTLPPVWFY